VCVVLVQTIGLPRIATARVCCVLFYSMFSWNADRTLGRWDAVLYLLTPGRSQRNIPGEAFSARFAHDRNRRRRGSPRSHKVELDAVPRTSKPHEPDPNSNPLSFYSTSKSVLRVDCRHAPERVWAFLFGMML
jgi:hypothetical protein